MTRIKYDLKGQRPLTTRTPGWYRPRKTPTPPNMARPRRKMFAIAAFMLALGCAAAWGMPYVFAAITSYVEVGVI